MILKKYRIVFPFFLVFFWVSCKTMTLREAELLHQSGGYIAAADGYYDLYRRTPRKHKERKAYMAFKAGENYRYAWNASRAYNAYMRALNLNYPDSIIYLRLAQQLQRLEKYEDAKSFYLQFLKYAPNDYFARIGLEGVALADSLRHQSATAVGYRVIQASKYNSSQGDFAATYAPQGDAIYFTSSRGGDPTEEVSLITGLRANDIYIIRKNASGEWLRPDTIVGGLGTPADEGTPAISPDGTTMYYSYAEQKPESDQTVKIYTTRKNGDGGWNKGTPVEIWSDTLRMAAHPAVNASGTLLYFVSDQGGYGGKDIYCVPIGGERKGLPANLGPAINTPGDELFPTLVGDSTLFFASNGHAGLGGLDLYEAHLDSLGNWIVNHLPPPINSGADDFSLAFSPLPKEGLAREGLLSSNRKDGRGRPHLYHVLLEAITTQIDGFVMDWEGNPISGAVVRIVDKNGQVTTPQVISREDGSYRLIISGENDYLFHASHSNYLSQYTQLTAPPSQENTTFFVDFFLAAKFRPEALRDIYYDFDAAELRPESKKSLDELVKVLKENPETSIEISAHADRKGGDAYNLSLTSRRAEAVVAYLVQNGIEADRLRHKGYSHQKPYVVSKKMSSLFPFLPEGQVLSREWIETLTESEQGICDQLNRRTEFQVLTKQDSEVSSEKGASKKVDRFE